MYIARSGENSPFISIIATRAIAWNICLRDLTTCLRHQFFYNAAVLAPEDSKPPISDFFWLKFAICKGRQIKTIIVYTQDQTSSLYVWVHAGGNTGIAIFMPTSKCSLATAGSRFLPAFDGSFSVVKWSLEMCSVH